MWTLWIPVVVTSVNIYRGLKELPKSEQVTQLSSRIKEAGISFAGDVPTQEEVRVLCVCSAFDDADACVRGGCVFVSDGHGCEGGHQEACGGEGGRRGT